MRKTPAVLEGIVKGPDGKPVDQALVLAQPPAASYGESPLSARTDAKGAFRLTLTVPTPHTLRVEAKGFAGQTLRRVRPGSPVTVTLSKGRVVEGVVRDGGTGQPLAGARVEAREDGALSSPWDAAAGVVEATTDAKGRFRLEGLGTGIQTVWATGKGYGRAQKRSVAMGAPVELYLFPGSSLSGTVIGPDGRGVASAVVRAETESFSPPGVRTAVSDTAGRFELLGLERGTYRLIACHPDFAPATLAGVYVEAEGAAQADLVLTPGSAVVGRLLSGEERPVKGRVNVQEVDGQPAPRSLAELLRGEAGEDGRFRIERVGPGSYALAMHAPGFAPKRVELEVSPRGREASVGDVVLEVGLAIRGQVRDKAGAPIPSPQITALLFRPGSGVLRLGEEQRGEADGSFVLAGLNPGSYQVTARAPGFGEATRTADAGTDDLEIVLEPAGTVTGLVVDERDRPVEDARVAGRSTRRDSVIIIGPWSSRETTTASDGRFKLEDVGEGTWVLEVTAQERVTATLSPVKVAAGSTTDLGRVRLAAGGTVRGSVVQAAGPPIPGATVALLGTGGHESVSDGQGLFELRGVPAGAVDLLATHPAYAEERVLSLAVDPAKGPTETRIVLTQGGRIEGWVRRRDGRGVPGARVRVSPAWNVLDRGPETLTAADGSFAVDHVPEGFARVRVWGRAGGGPGSGQTREVHVGEGETSTVEFVSREILVTGRVLRRGEPAPSLHVWLRGGTGSHLISIGSADVSAAPAGPERQRAVTREDGSFGMIVDEPGEYVAQVETLDGKVSYPSREVEIPDTESHFVDLVLAAAPVAGIIVDADDDRPIPNATVSASPTGPAPPGLGRGAGTSGSDGRFLLELEPGRYRLVAGAQGYAAAEATLSVDSIGVADVRLALPRGRSLSGRVTDPAGRGVSRVYVAASMTGSARPRPRTVWTLGDGSFTFTGLAPGHYDVYAWLEEVGFALRAGVAAGAQGVGLALRPGSHARVLVRGPDGAPEPYASVSVIRVGDVGVPDLQMPGSTDPEGLLELTLPPGVLELRAWARALEGQRAVSVPEGGTVAVEITLLPTHPARAP